MTQPIIKYMNNVISYYLISTADRLGRRTSRSPSARRSLLSPLGSIQDYEKLAVIGEGSYATVFKVGHKRKRSRFHILRVHTFLSALLPFVYNPTKSLFSLFFNALRASALNLVRLRLWAPVGMSHFRPPSASSLSKRLNCRRRKESPSPPSEKPRFSKV